jgi:triphosphatase
MGVAVRRLRAVLSAVMPLTLTEHYAWAQEELKWLANALGPARNCDVLVANLLEPMERVPAAEADLKLLAEAAEQRRGAAYAGVREATESPRYTAIMLKLAQGSEAQGWHDQPVSKEAVLLFATIGDVAPQLIEGRRRQARKRSRQLGKLPPEHRTRVADRREEFALYDRVPERHLG